MQASTCVVWETQALLEDDDAYVQGAALHSEDGLSGEACLQHAAVDQRGQHRPRQRLQTSKTKFNIINWKCIWLKLCCDELR